MKRSRERCQKRPNDHPNQIALKINNYIVDDAINFTIY
jgi:hypothetical protein